MRPLGPRGRVTRLCALTLALAWPSAVGSVDSSQVGVVSIEVAEIDQLYPVDVDHAVPTGALSVVEIVALNLPVWARDATDAAVLAVDNLTLSAAAPITTQLGSLEDSVRAAVDPDLAVHACVVNATGSCDVATAPTEDANRYLDLRVVYMYAADTDAAPDDDDGAARERGGGALRFVVAEDAANAVNAPSSFDVTIAQLWIEGNNVSATRSYIGAHQTPADAGRCLDDEDLDWASSALVFAVVDTTAEWPWAECTPRDPGAFTEATARGQLRFEAELRRAVLAVEDSADGRWFVRFAGDPRPPGPGPVDQFRSGVVVYVQYTLCGHLMEIPLTVQSLGLSRS